MATIVRFGNYLPQEEIISEHVPVLGTDFTYTGTCQVIDDSDAVSGIQWRIKFLTSGTLITTEDWLVDVFLVGGRASGSAGSKSATSGSFFGPSGNGGRGGNKKL